MDHLRKENRTQRSVTEGKACGEDNIPANVLKRGDLDDKNPRIPQGSNRNTLPPQW